jgi:hypothetical protein
MARRDKEMNPKRQGWVGEKKFVKGESSVKNLKKLCKECALILG